MTGQLRDMGDLAELHRIAARQYGTFSIHQVRAAGFNRAAVHRKVSGGMWHRLDDAVYGLTSARPNWKQTLWTAALSRQEALLTHWTACRIFGLSDVPNHRPTILVPRAANTRSKAARIFETDQLAQIASTEVDGLRVTTMPETILVMARDVEAGVITRVFDEALIRGLLDLKAMSGCIDREAGRRTPGTPLLRRLTSSRMPTAPSQPSTYLEALLEFILHDPRMPRWVREYELSLDDVPSRVDFYVPSARVVVEADGRNWHGRWADMETDRRRDNALAARGVVVLRFTYEMLTTESDKCLRQAIDTCLLRAA